MKKILLASAIAVAAILPASVIAQDDAKEFNMVITLQNGTTVTLGHNDVKNITFNGENIDITGDAVSTIASNANEINELWQQLSQTSEYISQVLNSCASVEVTDTIKNEVNELWMQLSQSQEMISQVLNSCASKEVTDTIKNEVNELWMQLSQSQDMMSQVLNSCASKEDNDSVKYEVNELWMALNGPKGIQDQISQVINTYTPIVVTDSVKNEVDQIWQQLSQSQEMLSQTMTVLNESIDQKTDDLWNEIKGEGGLSDQMSQYYNANKDEIAVVAKSNEDLWVEVKGEGGLSDQMSQYYNSNKADIEANTNKIALLEDSLRMIADPTDEDSMMMRMSEALSNLQDQIDALNAKIAELEGNK